MDMEKVKAAREVINQLANGVNPLNNSPLPEGDIINNVHLSRCLFFVSDVLRKVIEEEKVNAKTPVFKAPFAISYDQLTTYKYSNTPIALSKIIQRINDLIDVDKMQKLSFDTVADWLIASGFLKWEIGEDGKKIRLPTKAGTDIGIATKRSISNNREKVVAVYNRAAQQFILDNLEGLLENASPKMPNVRQKSRAQRSAIRGIDIFVD
ncbi:MAG: hypothetical protein J6R77_05045 [Clostridia bacterium]|nr:hypothetical protein [Clostridia bacterium]